MTAHQLICITSHGRICPELLIRTACSSTIVISFKLDADLEMATDSPGTLCCVSPTFKPQSPFYPHFPSSPTNRPSPKESSFPSSQRASLALRCIPQPPRQGVSCGPQSGGGGMDNEKSLSRLSFAQNRGLFSPGLFPVFPGLFQISH